MGRRIKAAGEPCEKNMRNAKVCEFFATDRNVCDIGHAYISPHDVELIVRHCIAHYEECPRYQMLVAQGRLAKIGKNGADNEKQRMERSFSRDRD